MLVDDNTLGLWRSGLIYICICIKGLGVVFLRDYGSGCGV